MNRALKILAGLFGSLILALSLSFFIISIIGDHFIANVDKFDDTIKSVSSTFIEENRPALRSLIEEKLQGQEIPNKDKLLFACQNINLVQGDMAAFLSPEFCSALPLMPPEDVNTAIHDFLIDSNINRLVEAASSGQGAKDVMNQIQSIQNPMPAYLAIILFIVFYLIGSCLLFASASFNLIAGFYKVVLKTFVVLLTFTLFLFIISIIPLDSFVGFLQFVISGISLELPALPGIMLKFVVAIILDWMRLTTNAILPWIAVLAVPFAVGSFFLYRKNRKLTEEAKKEIDDKQVEKLVKVGP